MRRESIESFKLISSINRKACLSFGQIIEFEMIVFEAWNKKFKFQKLEKKLTTN